MRAAARYLKGCEMLEPYAVKVARTVLRRGGASNRFLLSLHFNSLRHRVFASLRLCVFAFLFSNLTRRLRDAETRRVLLIFVFTSFACVLASN
ncbi:MAG: hypothetical protein EF813_00710 [Methanosarcinales archaeon]|nr:MAG: hypothetical protein EF813_00710 [Methanosarcinales archaeon]